MPLSGSERQRRYRERNQARLAEERRAARERARQRALYALTPTPACFCCEEGQVAFLGVHEGRVVCRNCEHALRAFGYCPHHGVSGRLG